MTHQIHHNWEHIQEHVVADAWANSMGSAVSMQNLHLKILMYPCDKRFTSDPYVFIHFCY